MHPPNKSGRLLAGKGEISMFKHNRLLILLILMIIIDSYARFAHSSAATILAVVVTIATLLYVVWERIKRG